jgi:ATPase subunit of ABC transporter with duplicated ATPase domains
MDWLIQYLTKKDTQTERTVMVVSHDRIFLDAVCTDMVVMEHQRLSYHVGNYSEFQRQIQKKATRHAQILDASERQRSKALAFVQKQQNNKKSTDAGGENISQVMTPSDKVYSFRGAEKNPFPLL